MAKFYIVNNAVYFLTVLFEHYAQSGEKLDWIATIKLLMPKLTNK